eukprot:gene1911-biopygen13959
MESSPTWNWTAGIVRNECRCYSLCHVGVADEHGRAVPVHERAAPVCVTPCVGAPVDAHSGPFPLWYEGRVHDYVGHGLGWAALTAGLRAQPTARWVHRWRRRRPSPGAPAGRTSLLLTGRRGRRGGREGSRGARRRMVATAAISSPPQLAAAAMAISAGVAVAPRTASSCARARGASRPTLRTCTRACRTGAFLGGLRWLR